MGLLLRPPRLAALAPAITGGGVPSITSLFRETNGSVTILSFATVSAISLVRQPDGSVTVGA